MSWVIQIISIIRRVFLPAIITNYNHDDIEAKGTQVDRGDALAKAASSPMRQEPSIFAWPVPSHRISSRFGWRELEFDGVKHKNLHTGVDLVGVGPKTIIAPEDGIIKKVVPRDFNNPCLFVYTATGWVKATPPAGKTWYDGTWAWTPYIVLIGVHTNNMYVFKHCVTTLVPGAQLKVGDKVGEYGNYGYSMGAHCHFEVRPFDVAKNDWADFVDPDKFMTERGAV